MPSVYSYRHVELDNVGRGKRVIKPPGGETADIFGSRDENKSSIPSSAASSQAGSDVATARMHMDVAEQQQQPAVEGAGGAALLADDFKPNNPQLPQQQPQNQQIPQQMNIQLMQQQGADAGRTPKKTIPTLRRNPITGEVYDAPAMQMPVRVRQPPGGKSSGIF